MAVKVLAWPATRLGPQLAAALGCECSDLQLHRFPDGETLVRIATDVKGEAVVIAASLDRPDDKLLPLAFAADAARELGATRVVLVAPYLAYMRQDSRFHAGEAVTSRTFARLLSSTFDALVTVDPHLHRWASLAQIYAVPSRIVPSAPAIAAWIAQNVAQPLIVGPDAESEQWVAEVARLADAPYTVLEKQRRGDLDVDVHLRDALVGETGAPVLVDDIVSTGHTLVAAAQALHATGLRDPIAVGVHVLADAPELAAIRAAGVSLLVSCDTVEHPTNHITLVPELARAVRAELKP
ncbi:MAG TPA: ribose-phosphate diphosphokinase [Ramlibacter sp.]